MNLTRRLRKLEQTLTDGSGLVPNSRAWMDHWTQELTKVLDGNRSGRKPRIPLEVVRAYLQAEADSGNSLTMRQPL